MKIGADPDVVRKHQSFPRSGREAQGYHYSAEDFEEELDGPPAWLWWVICLAAVAVFFSSATGGSL